MQVFTFYYYVFSHIIHHFFLFIIQVSYKRKLYHLPVQSTFSKASSAPTPTIAMMSHSLRSPFQEISNTNSITRSVKLYKNIYIIILIFLKSELEDLYRMQKEYYWIESAMMQRPVALKHLWIQLLDQPMHLKISKAVSFLPPYLFP